MVSLVPTVGFGRTHGSACFLFKKLVSLFMDAVGLPAPQAVSSCGRWGLLFIAVLGFLAALPSLAAVTGSRHVGRVVAAHGLS